MRTYSLGFKTFLVSLLLGWSLGASCCAAPQSKDPFVAVFVDDTTEKELGPIPYDRSKFAEAIKNLRLAGAKAVVIKYFLDRAKPGAGDDQLAAEMKLLPVLLQARLDPKEPKPNPLPAGLDRSAQIQGDVKALLTGESGWIPLEKFNLNCAGIGFVDIASAKNLLNIPMALRYQKAILPSLELAAVELAFGQRSQIQLGRFLTLAGHRLPLSLSGEIPVQLPPQDKIQWISFLDVLQGKFDTKSVSGKIVILGFDAKETPTLPTALGPLRIHRLFYYSLMSLYEQLAAH